MKINLMPVEHRPLKQSKVRWEFVVISLGLALLIVVPRVWIYAEFAVGCFKAAVSECR